MWQIVRDHRVRDELAPGSCDIDARLRGKDLRQYIPEANLPPVDRRTARRVSQSLNEAAWRARRKGDAAARRADTWAPDVRILLSLASLNAEALDDTVVSWHYCMNIAFAFEVLTPRERTADEAFPVPIGPSSPWVPFVDMAKVLGVVEWEVPGAVTGALSGTARLARREIRRFGPVAYLLQLESIRQAVRNGDRTVMPVHVLAAVVSAASQLRLVGGVVAERFAPALGAGLSLLGKGIEADRLKGPAAPEPRASIYGGKFWQRFHGDLRIGDPAFAFFEEAEAIAARDGRRQIGDGDLVSAITASDDPATLSIIETIGLDS
ncbi:hypothetical protein [Glycomyces arizonensis]|uniref:hypothetical protein n=1 Tax=Glycomyces arizonensis TaxID=256035 RepID=UPI0004091431|nr:hypothetical protein [Glycomyces arizonensis]